MEEATKIWGAFEKARGEFEEVEDEDRARDAEDDEWGIGEVEEVEGEGRERNGQFALASRGGSREGKKLQEKQEE